MRGCRRESGANYQHGTAGHKACTKTRFWDCGAGPRTGVQPDCGKPDSRRPAAGATEGRISRRVLGAAILRGGHQLQPADRGHIRLCVYGHPERPAQGDAGGRSTLQQRARPGGLAALAPSASRRCWWFLSASGPRGFCAGCTSTKRRPGDASECVYKRLHGSMYDFCAGLG